MSIQYNHNPASQTATTQSSFCQAMYFFHTCGCRAPEPVFCCRPPPHLQTEMGNPCRHEKPALVVAKLPHACGRRIGNSETCGAEDPGAKEFVREADTAERLELVVSEGVEQDKIHNALPGKVEGAFTVDEVVSKSQRSEKCRSIFSATAAPFVPRLGGCDIGMGSATVAGEGVETADKMSNETAENTPADDAEMSMNEAVTDEAVTDEAITDKAVIDEAVIDEAATDEATTCEAVTDDAFTDEAATDGAEQDEGVQRDKKSESQSDGILAEERTCDQTTGRTEPEDDDDDRDASEEFHDIELKTPIREHTIPDEEPDSASDSSTSTAEQTAKNESLEPPVPPEDSYDDMLVFWAMDGRKAKPKPSRTCFWGITSFFGRSIQ